jgi:hypothetical protein
MSSAVSARDRLNLPDILATALVFGARCKLRGQILPAGGDFGNLGIKDTCQILHDRGGGRPEWKRLVWTGDWSCELSPEKPEKFVATF